MKIIIRYIDSDYTINFSTIGEYYCNEANEDIEYCKSNMLDDNDAIRRSINSNMDPMYIKAYFINGAVGDVIKQYQAIKNRYAIIDSKSFDKIKQIVENMVSSLEIVTDEYFETIKDNLGECDTLVIDVNNDKFTYKIY